MFRLFALFVLSVFCVGCQIGYEPVSKKGRSATIEQGGSRGLDIIGGIATKDGFSLHATRSSFTKCVDICAEAFEACEAAYDKDQEKVDEVCTPAYTKCVETCLDNAKRV